MATPLRIGAAVGVIFVVLPIVGLVARVPVGSIGGVLSSRVVARALLLSIETSVVAAALCLGFGLPLAAWLAADTGALRRVVRALVALSMVMPPVVAGVALFAAYGRTGIVGKQLDTLLGVRVPFTTTAVVLAQTFVAMPFLVLTVESALRGLDQRPVEAARTLGASEWFAFTRVVIPAIRPALIAGVVLAWARALGEFGATITFAGNLPGVTQTMPLATYLELQSDPGAATVMALVMVAISFAVLVGLRGRWLGGIDR